MDDQYIGEIRITGFNFPPKGWAFCNGQILAIAQNQALFSILGTTYGGNGTTTFALPNLQGRVAMHTQQGQNLGQAAGEAQHTLNTNEIGHGHMAGCTKAGGTQGSPQNGVPAALSGTNIYGGSAQVNMNAGVIAPVGGGQAHDNMQPYQVVNFIIAITGIYPSRS